MKGGLYRSKEFIAEKLELPKDVILNIPKITIVGREEIHIENHKGIIIFEEKMIKVSSSEGDINVYGENFQILFMGGSTLIIGGKFKNMEYNNG